MTAIPFHELARLLSERMLNGMAAGVVIALLAWTLLRLAGRQTSSTRFAVWFSALVAIATLPLVGRLVSSPVEGASTDGSAIALPASWAVRLFLAWALIAAVGLLRLTAGLWRLRKLRASAVAIELFALDPVLRKTLGDFRSRRKVTLCVSEQQRVPAAIGFFKPLIVLPAWALRDLSTAELNSILIHELAHLRRWDDWTNLMQKVLHATFFFHPAVWWVENQLSLEREMACDDVVLAHTANPRSYAECLVSMAERSFLRRSLALTQAAVSRMRETSRRVAQILDADRPGATGIWKPALGLVATFALICGISQSRAPKLVSFRDSQSAAATVAASATTTPMLQTVALNIEPAESLTNQPGKTSALKPVVGRKVAARAMAPVAIEARLDRHSDATAIQAKAAASAVNPAAAETVLVVLQGQQYSFSGQVQWTVWVWRVNLQTANPTPVEARVPAKRT